MRLPRSTPVARLQQNYNRRGHSEDGLSGREKVRGWQFTLNNPTEDDMARIQSMPELSYVKRMLVAREVGDSGTPHLQGQVMFTEPVRLAQAKKRIGRRAHLEPVIHWSSLTVYNEKDGDIFVDFNMKSSQGARSDLTSFCLALTESSLADVGRDNPATFVRYHRGLAEYKNLLAVPRDPNTGPDVTWIHGGPGVGKSLVVHRREPDLWSGPPANGFYNGYNNQPAVIFDDFRCDDMPLRELLRILDRYPTNVNTKGGYRLWQPARIYITSCWHPRDVGYDGDREDIAQLLRRIGRIIFLYDPPGHVHESDRPHVGTVQFDKGDNFPIDPLIMGGDVYLL